MVTRFVGDFRVLIVPGLNDSGPDHWQSSWQRLYPEFERVNQVRWDVPDLEVWADSLGSVLSRSQRQTLIVAHSFGCLAAVRHAELHTRSVAGALLVAPADPGRFGLEKKLERAVLPFPSILVGSGNDPWMSKSRAMYWAQRWGSEFVDAGNLGHINADSSLGMWLFGLTQLQRLMFSARNAAGGKMRKAIYPGSRCDACRN